MANHSHKPKETRRQRHARRMILHRARKYNELRKQCRRCRKTGSICEKHQKVRLGTAPLRAA